ncbi:MAG: Rieske 2Fe-2S domain-containing protein, partial [Chloroflexota bacterium]
MKVTEVENLPDGERIWHELEEEIAVIFNVSGEFFAIADLCSHDDGPLEDGSLEGYSVECPRHGACFDIRTGEALS